MKTYDLYICNKGKIIKKMTVECETDEQADEIAQAERKKLLA